MSTTKHQRSLIVSNVRRESGRIISSTPRASVTSEFFKQQLPPLPAGIGSKCQLFVQLGDTLISTRAMLESYPEFESQIMVLNMADDVRIAGGWARRAGQSQEDMLCYQSTLHATLQYSRNAYPFRRHLADNEMNGCGAIFSPGVVIFRDGAERNFRLLKENERRVVSVISAAAPFRPPTSIRDGQRQYSNFHHERKLREKARMLCRIAASKDKKVLVLGAWGCGSFANPVERVAQVMKEVVEEQEFVGRFSHVYWIVKDKSTYDIFQRIINT